MEPILDSIPTEFELTHTVSTESMINMIIVGVAIIAIGTVLSVLIKRALG